MKTRSLRFVPLSLVFALVVAVPTLAQESWDTPNNVSCSNVPGGTTANVPDNHSGEMNLRLKFKGAQSPVNTNVLPNGVLLACPETLVAKAEGRLIAKLGMERLCQAAGLAKPNAYVCTATNSTTMIPCVDLVCCSDALIGETVDITCNQAPGLVGFKLVRNANAEKFLVFQTKKPNASLNGNTTAGNRCGTDLLPQVMVRVDPQGQNGIVTFTVDHNSGPGPGPGPFTDSFPIDTALFNNDAALHVAIANGFTGLGINGLVALPTNREQRFVHSPFGEEYSGDFVLLPNARAVGVIRILASSSVDGQNIIVETNTTQAMIPTLNTWGILFLAVALLAGMLFFRRRQRLHHA